MLRRPRPARDSRVADRVLAGEQDRLSRFADPAVAMVLDLDLLKTSTTAEAMPPETPTFGSQGPRCPDRVPR
jgi:hypothetical protein